MILSQELDCDWQYLVNKNIKLNTIIQSTQILDEKYMLSKMCWANMKLENCQPHDPEYSALDCSATMDLPLKCNVIYPPASKASREVENLTERKKSNKNVI